MTHAHDPARRLDDADIETAAARLGVTVDPADMDLWKHLTQKALTAHDAVDALYDEFARPSPPVRSHRPGNPAASFGAWYVHTDLPALGDGPLRGMSAAIKDSVAVAGVPMASGSRALDGFVPDRDATIVTRLLHSGADIAGKSVCEDLCFSGSSFTSATGPVRNPWNPRREAGGSSSGSAVLVAAGEVDIAIGGDQGGSIRIPAAFCGVVGHKPTFGLVPYTGAMPFERTLDHLGPMAATVRGVAAALDAISGPDGLDSRQPAGVAASDSLAALGDGVGGLRIGILAEGFGQPGSDPAVDDLVRRQALRLGELGATVEPTSIPWHRRVLDVYRVIATVGGTHQMLLGNGQGLNADGEYDPELMSHFGSRWRADAALVTDLLLAVGIPGMFSLGSLHGATYGKARNLVPIARAAYDDALDSFDALVMPTVPFTPGLLPLGGEDELALIEQATAMTRNCAPFNVTGHPATSVPAGLIGGLPVGMMIVTRHREDATALRIAHSWEALVGGFPRPPARPVHPNPGV